MSDHNSDASPSSEPKGQGEGRAVGDAGVMCGKCNYPYPPQATTWCSHHKPRLAEPSLSLLVIDLGDSCAVKVERGYLPDNLTFGTTMLTNSVGSSNSILLRVPFDLVKYVLDAINLDDEPPVPRIERLEDGMVRVVGRDVSSDVPYSVLNTFRALTGEHLPIYKGKQGKWTELAAEPVKIYRYDR